jgi:hypothetical protein
MSIRFDSKGIDFGKSVIHVDCDGRLYFKEGSCDKRHYFDEFNKKCCNNDPKFRICSVTTTSPGSLPTVELVRRNGNYCFNFTFPSPQINPPAVLSSSVIPFSSGTPSLISTRVLIGSTGSVADTTDLVAFGTNYTTSSSDIPTLSIAGLPADTFTLSPSIDNPSFILPSSGNFISLTASVTITEPASVPSGNIAIHAAIFIAPPNSNVYTRPGGNLNTDILVCTLAQGGLGTFSSTKAITTPYASGSSVLLVIYGIGSAPVISSVTLRSKAGLKISSN